MRSPAISEFIVGEEYTNDQIRFALSVENLGGVRPSVDSRGNLSHLVILTTTVGYQRNIAENPYLDRIENNVLIYTAQGRIGDQEITGRNKRIIEQYSNPVPFYCFSNIGKQTYSFMGLLVLLRHYQEIQIDKSKTLRTVWVFEFQIHNEVATVPIDSARTLTESFFESSRNKIDNVAEREIVSLEAQERELKSPSSYELEEIRIQLLQVHPYKFEHLVKSVIEQHGFVNVNTTPFSGDGGIDVNAFVGDTNYFFSKMHVQFQVKRWRHAVGSIEINNFRGALSSTAKGVFVTTSHFTRAAIKEAEHPVKPCVSLIDGYKFSLLVKQSGIDLEKTY